MNKLITFMLFGLILLSCGSGDPTEKLKNEGAKIGAIDYHNNPLLQEIVISHN